MNTAYVDDSRIETRFVWARCAAEHAHDLRNLIKAFQSDGWATTRNVLSGKKRIVRRKKTARGK
jgi:hypothetical protein